jgi:hypothetical protein
LFQNHRDLKSWTWPKLETPSNDLEVKLKGGRRGHKEVGFLFHLSAIIRDDAILPHLSPHFPRFHLRVSNPSVSWLVHPSQIDAVAIMARQMFEASMAKFGSAERWHIFFAGPAPVAVALGQQISPTMFPAVQLYEFHQRWKIQYRPTISLGSS